jgi:hypothetical protein
MRAPARSRSKSTAVLHGEVGVDWNKRRQERMDVNSSDCSLGTDHSILAPIRAKAY